jgi:acyl carrier protein
VQPAAGAVADPELLREALRASLPEVMVPARIVLLDTLPRLPNAKIDRTRLPAPAFGSTPAATAPRTATETLLAALWAEVLDVDQVGVADDFFGDLGGHSLLATRLVARVADVFGVAVPLQRIFEAPSVAAFADAMASSDAERERTEKVAALFLEVSQLSEEQARGLLPARASTLAEGG